MQLIVYTLLRVALVLGAGAALYLVGMRSWALWIVAIVIGALLSYLLLGRQRQAAARVLAEHDPARRHAADVTAGRRRPTEDEAYEDAVVDAADGRTDAHESDPGRPDSRRTDAGEQARRGPELPGV